MPPSRKRSRELNGPETKLRQCISGAMVRPLALVGPTGSGKTSLLRTSARAEGVQVRWSSARELAECLASAIRDERLELFGEEVTTDSRLLVVEHVEDLRGRPRTRQEVRALLQDRSDCGHATVLTLTRCHAAEETLDWLRGWAEVLETQAHSARAPS